MSSLVRTIWRRQHRSSDRAEAHRAAQPPSTVITVLFTMLPASEATYTKAPATSRIWARRPIR